MTTSSRPFALWGIHWKQPCLMFVFYSIAVLAALGHHLFYQSLDSRPVSEQEWNLRAGTALSLTSKIALAASISVALSQRSWLTVQAKFLSLGAVDSLFAATTTPTNLLNTELLCNAKVAMLMASLIWVAPLVTVIAPGSLSVNLRVSSGEFIMPIMNLDFSRNESLLNDDENLRLVKFEEVQYGVFKEMSGGVGSPCYDRPSSRALALIYQTVYGGRVIQSASPCGSNCSFIQSFVGPSYKCTALDQYDESTPWCVLASMKEDAPCQQALYDSNDPRTATMYQARNSSGSFEEIYGGRWTDGNEWMGGEIWVRHRYLPEEWRAPTNLTIPGEAWQNYTFKCEQWDTQFHLTRIFTNSEQSIKVNTTFIQPIKYGLVGSEYQFITGYAAIRSEWPSYAIHQTLYSILKGQIGVTPRGAPSNEAGLDGTKLVEDVPFPTAEGIRKPRPNLRELFEELSQNVTISLLSLDGLVYLRPEEATVSQMVYINVFHYNRKALLLTYGVALLLGLIAIAIGSAAFYKNRISVNPGFLSFLVSTRNPTLDEISRGSCLGAEPMSEELRTVKIKYGELASRRDRASNVPHTCFGVPGEVIDIDSHTQYQ